MYNFEEFVKQVRTGLEKMLRNRYGEANVGIVTARKINCEMVGLICDVNNTYNVSPTIYMESLYSSYMEHGDMEVILERATEAIQGAMKECHNLKSKINNFTEETDQIIFQLIHTEQNKELLETMPHRNFLDMSIVYRRIIDIDEEGIFSAPINHNLADAMGLDEEDLYQLAYDNTRKILKPKFYSMSQIIEELQGSIGVTEEEMSNKEMEQSTPLYVVTNSIKNWGAASVLYLGQLQAFAEKLGSDLYLLPSSVHEMIITEADSDMLETLESMVYEVNQTLPIEDRLSNEVYLYDRENNSLTQATDSSHKMLVEEENENIKMQMGM